MVLTSTISQLELALEGKIDFFKKTNPFGNGEKEEDKISKEPSDPQAAMQKLINMARRRQGNRSKTKRK